jgi:hypothetical protein
LMVCRVMYPRSSIMLYVKTIDKILEPNVHQPGLISC